MITETARLLHSGFMLLLFGLASTSVCGKTLQDTAPYKSVSVLTYNVLHHTDTFVDDLKSLIWGKPLPTDRIAPTLDLLARQDADIIALQEVTPVLLAAIQRHAGLRSYHVTSTLPTAETGWRRYLARLVRYMLGQQPWGQSILSKWPISKVHSYPMGRPLLITEIAIEDMMLTVATCHLDSLPENHAKRIWQLQQTFRHLGSARHALLLGDFNFGDHEPEQKTLHTAYTDVWHTKPDDPGYTHPATNRMTSSIKTNRRIDRILLRSQQLEPLHVGLIGVNPVEHNGIPLYLSDHYGVIAQLRRPGS